MSELCDRFAAAYQLAGIWENNPTWRQPSKCLTGTKDHMNARTWSQGPEGTTSVSGVSVQDYWMGGRGRAVETLEKHSGYKNITLSMFHTLSNDGVTMLKPWSGDEMPGLGMNEESEEDISGQGRKQEEEDEKKQDEDEGGVLRDEEAVDEAVFDTAISTLVPTESLEKTIKIESNEVEKIRACRMILSPPEAGKVSTDRRRRVMGIDTSPRASAVADDHGDDGADRARLDVGDPFLSLAHLGQGGDVTMALFVAVRHGGVDTDDRLRGRLARLLPTEPAEGGDE